MTPTELIFQIRALLEKATPGPWRWWTSNSFRRLSSVQRLKERVAQVQALRDSQSRQCLRCNRTWNQHPWMDYGCVACVVDDLLTDIEGHLTAGRVYAALRLIRDTRRKAGAS